MRERLEKLKLCPKCNNVLDDNDICFHHEKPHPRSNRAYYCSNCKKVLCWIELIDSKSSVTL